MGNKKYMENKNQKMLDLPIVSSEFLNDRYVLMKFKLEESINASPGQFVQLKIENSPKTFLRRPISICYIDEKTNLLWLLVQVIGEGTNVLTHYPIGTSVNMLLPLGNGFSTNIRNKKVILIGGGVGTAPLLSLGHKLYESGNEVFFLLGGRTASDIVLADEFKKYGTLLITTEDGSLGEKGFVTNHSSLEKLKFDRIYSCGPKPMMKNVAKYAQNNSIECEVSLENMMACGIGACLCCVEDTKQGNLRVCKEGPVFNIKRLKW